MGQSGHDPRAASRVAQLRGLSDDGLVTRGFHKQHSGANLGSHAAFGEVTFSQILLGLSHCDGVQSLLVFLAEIDVDLRHIGEACGN